MRVADAGSCGIGPPQWNLSTAWASLTAMTTQMASIDYKSCDLLAMFVALFLKKLNALAMAEVELMTNDPFPAAERVGSDRSIGGEIAKFAYVEEALVAAAVPSGTPGHAISRNPARGNPQRAYCGITRFARRLTVRMDRSAGVRG